MMHGKRPPTNPSKVLLNRDIFPYFLPTNAAKVSPRLIKISDIIAIFFENTKIVKNEPIITHVAPVNCPFNS